MSEESFIQAIIKTPAPPCKKLLCGNLDFCAKTSMTCEKFRAWAMLNSAKAIRAASQHPDLKFEVWIERLSATEDRCQKGKKGK